MPITVQAVRDEIHQFFEDIRGQAADQALATLNQSLPLFASVLPVPAAQQVFATLEGQIQNALAGLAPDATAAEIADALSTVAGIEATISGGGIDISLIEREAVTLADGTVALSAGAPGIGLELDAATHSDLAAELNVKLRLDDTGQLAVADNGGTKELTIGVEASLGSGPDGKIGDGELGFLKIEAHDNEVDTPELQLAFTFDLPTGDADGLATAIAPDLTGSAHLDLELTTTETDFLPSITTDLVVDFPLTGTFPFTPSVSLNDITLDLGSYLGVLGKALGDIADVFNTSPFGELFDVITAPIPVIDDLAHTFDRVETFDRVGRDGVVSLLDLAALNGADEASPLVDALVAIDTIRRLGDASGLGPINLGSIDLPANIGDAQLQGTGGDAPDKQADDAIRNAGGPLAELAASFSDLTGLHLSLLENPRDIVGLLLNEVFDPVTLLEYDVPRLAVKESFKKFIPILGPLGAEFNLDLGAGIDIKVGYDTFGFEFRESEKGFFFSTPRITLADGVTPAPFDDTTNPHGFAPAGSVHTTIGAAAAVRAVVLNASVGVDITYDLRAFFENDEKPAPSDGKLRFEGIHCWFDPVKGQATANATVEIEVGFDPFSWSERIPLASVVLANFEVFKCPPPSGETSPPGLGLATPEGSNLRLNTGPERAAFRVFNDEQGIPGPGGTDVAEFYIIRNAVDVVDRSFAPGASSVVNPVPDQLDINAFGITQRFGAPGAPPTQISGKLGAGNDSLFIAKDVLQGASVEGNDGDDYISGGAGNDTFDGGIGKDFLIGNDGDDVLKGGGDEDVLDGGKGADDMDGEAGRDRVSYEFANSDSRIGVTMFAGLDARLRVAGGDADGDVLSNIEEIIGTAYDDVLQANQMSAGLGDYNTLDGRGGDDTLTGAANRDDYLLGGAGADTIDGGLDDGAFDGNAPDIVDGTSYLFSFGGVHIDLNERIFRGGDAQGDILIRIESVQGSSFDDVIFGDANKNQIDGFVGNDVLGGGGGVDTVSGGHGNDLIFAAGDGDTLDGGGTVNDSGIDLLSYVALSTGVTVNLKTGDGGGSDTLVGAKRLVVPAGGGDPVPEAATGYSTFENLEGSNANDTLTGDLGYNVIWGLAGADQINGDDGNDTLVGGAGADVLDGGSGRDWADYQDSFASVTADLFFGEGIGGTADGDRLSNIENLRGSDFSDQLNGDSADNVIDPGLSDSLLPDRVDGGSGIDTLLVDYSDAQSDTGKGIAGGFDRGSVQFGFLAREERLTSGNADMVLFGTMEQLHLIGTIYADEVYGGQLMDKIETGSGNDVIVSGLGRDFVRAGDGDDFVTTGATRTRS